MGIILSQAGQNEGTVTGQLWSFGARLASGTSHAPLTHGTKAEVTQRPA